MSSVGGGDGVFLIDTKMFGFSQYNAAYLVRGEELVLVDTGGPGRFETVKEGIIGHGFSPKDISYILITHTHIDHCGNVAPFLMECPSAKVYAHPLGAENLTDPSVAQAIRKRTYNPAMFSRFTDMEPVPSDRIRYFNDGDVFDLGAGVTLRVIYAPGHQPDGVVFYKEDTKGLFINDLVGNFLQDADALYALNPSRSDHAEAVQSLRSLMSLEMSNLYMGHYGVNDKPIETIDRAVSVMQGLLDIGMKQLREGNPDSIADKVMEATMPELEKLRRVRGEDLFTYAALEHMPSQAAIFSDYCKKKFT